MLPGGVVLLAKAMEQGPLRSRAAYCVLSGLLDRSMMLEEQVAEREALLARMQGVRRFFALLCPMYVQEEERDEATAGGKCMDGLVSHRQTLATLWQHVVLLGAVVNLLIC